MLRAMPPSRNKKGLIIREIPVPDVHHPPAPFEELPRHEFTMGLIAPKGGGKTTTICNILRIYSGYFHQIWWWSPTILSDDKLGWVKKQKFLAKNTALKEFFKSLQEAEPEEDKLVQNKRVDTQMDMVRNDPPEDTFTGFIPEECFVDFYTDEKLKEILDEQKSIIDLLEKYGRSKHVADRILMVFDDPVGMDLYTNCMKSYFKGINTRHRHYSLSGLEVSQGYKEVPKTIRTNWTCCLLYEIGNMKELFVIYEEFTMGLDWKTWLELYRYATSERHNFMFLDFQKDPKLRIMKNFTEYISAKPMESESRIETGDINMGVPQNSFA